MTTAYNYEMQRWVSGEEGTALRLRQLREELDLVESDRGAEYLAFVGSRETPAERAALIRADILLLEGAA